MAGLPAPNLGKSGQRFCKAKVPSSNLAFGSNGAILTAGSKFTQSLFGSYTFPLRKYRAVLIQTFVVAHQ